ncbi:hypothetical protein FRB95_008706 [Tulasnella sp. JGI-2019a]|nr:hypothetical protein FRB95_008706 [Tulasnella sp. JGI-2019a]
MSIEPRPGLIRTWNSHLVLGTRIDFLLHSTTYYYCNYYCNFYVINNTLSEMSETASETAKLTLQTLVDVLNALPIPPPFKDATLAILKLSLRIMEISQSVKRNKSDAKDLARYMPYNEDLGTVAGFKERIEDARHIIETEINLATLALVEDINGVVTEMRDTAGTAALAVSNTQAVLSDTALAAIVTGTHNVAGNTNAMMSDTQNVVLDTNAVSRATHIGVVSLEHQIEDNSRNKLECERCNCVLTVVLLANSQTPWDWWY